MAFEVYFNISKTAIEIIALAAVGVALVYVVDDLTKEDKNPEVIPTEG